MKLFLKTLNYDRNFGHNLVSYKTKTRKNIHDSIKGGRLIYCQECGKLVHVVNKQDNSKKYCKKCKQEKDLEKQKKYDNKKRGK